MNIRTKIILLGAGSALSVGLLSGLYTARLSAQASEHRLADFEATLRADFDRSAKREVETALSLLKGVTEQARRDGRSPEEARKLAADLLRGLRYDGENYFWADTYEGVNVVLLGKAAEGKDRLDLKDKRGTPFIRQLLAAGRAGGGYTDYFFPRGDGTEALPKRAYTAAFEPFGWVVGTGNYVDDIDRMVAKEREDEAAKRQAAFLAIAAGVLLSVVAAAAAAAWLARSLTRPLAFVAGEAERLTAAVAEGRLGERGDVDRVDPEFRPIVAGLNATLDAYARPLQMTVENVARLGRGEIPPPITEAFRGDFNRIKESLNAAIAGVNALVADAAMLAEAGVAGKLATRADAGRHQGDFRKIVQGFNDTLDAVVGPLGVASACLDQIARGEVPGKITGEYRGDFARVRDDLNTCIEAIDRLVADAHMLAEAGVAGKLATRADATRHQGDFREIVEGVNRTLDAVVGPLTVAARYVDGISKGQIPPRITDAYAGDFNAIKENLNGCIDAVNRLVADAQRLAEAGVAGRLSTRADAAQHQGDFRKVVEGVNRTLDAVTAPIGEAAGVLERLAARDLRARVGGAFQGDHARIKEAVNATATALHDALAQVAEAVEQVSSASQQIAASSQAVASGASEQAASLEETSSSIETVASVTRHATDAAQQANGLAQSARGAATAGAAAVDQLQGAMGRIKASAEATGAIIKDINEIAFQTNLLALNAAVEAARAGEAGRGFAVVAEEVRSLALRAKEAAQKTEELIKQSVKEAGEGEGASRQVSGRLGEIVAGIGKVTDIVSEIAAAAREQSNGIDQVTKAVAEMDKVTQQNAASAEESSSAASELNGQAEELAAMVAGFRLERGGAAAPGQHRALHGVARA